MDLCGIAALRIKNLEFLRVDNFFENCFLVVFHQEQTTTLREIELYTESSNKNLSI